MLMRTSLRLRSAAVLLAASTLTLAGCSETQDELADPALTTVETSPAEEQAETPEASQPSSEKKEEKPTTKKDDEKDEDKNKDEKEEKKTDEPTDDRSNVAAGTVCGEAGSRGDEGTLSIVTLDDGMDCDVVMEVFTDYMSDSPSGTPPQGSGAFWTAPNGWFCGSNNFLFPGDEDHKMNKYPSCGPQDVNKNAVAIPAARISELPV